MNDIKMTERESEYLEFKRHHNLKQHICDIPWDLREGPNVKWDNPKGRKITIIDELVDFRDDAVWPFTDICMLFHDILTVRQVVEFLKTFSNQPDNYKQFLNIVRYLTTIEIETGDEATSIKTYLYFTSLNGLLGKPPSAFDFILKKLDRTITKDEIKALKEQYEKEHSIGRKYEFFFKNYLPKEYKKLLLDKIQIAEKTTEHKYKNHNLDSGKMAKTFYRVMRCNIAHGSMIIPLTYDPGTSILNRFVFHYEERGKNMMMFSELSIKEWKVIIKQILYEYFRKQNFR